MISAELSRLLEHYTVIDRQEQKFIATLTDTNRPDEIQDGSFVSRLTILLEQKAVHEDNPHRWATDFCSNLVLAGCLVMDLDSLRGALVVPHSNPLEARWREIRNSSVR